MMKDQARVTTGNVALHRYIQYLEPLAKCVETPCDTFSTIILGLFGGGEEKQGFALVLLHTGGEHPQHLHEHSRATLYFMSGKGYVVLGEDQRLVPYRAGVVVDVPAGTYHGFKVEEEGLMISHHVGRGIIDAQFQVDIKYRDERCFTAHATVT